MRVERDHVTALVIDIQERLFPHIHEHDHLASRCAMLIRGLQLLNVPILVTQQYTKGLGPTIAPIAEALGEHDAHEKMVFSAAGNHDVESRLLGSHGHQAIIMGIETHVCVLQTVQDIHSQGRRAIVVEDCVSSRNANDKRIAIERMRALGATITTAESLLFELMETAEHKKFKEISALVK
jgi:nicotinamidase-related amidase